MNPKKTHVVVIAKSGSTAETIATFLIVQDWLTAKLGKKAAQRISVVTSEGHGDLKKLATREKYTNFPSAGECRRSIQRVVRRRAASCRADRHRHPKAGERRSRDDELVLAAESAAEYRAARGVCCTYLIWTRRNKSIQVAFPYSNQLWGTAFWFRQLVGGVTRESQEP